MEKKTDEEEEKMKKEKLKSINELFTTEKLNY
jgi:hypothetical protein